MGYTCPELMNASEFYLNLMSLEVEEEDTDDVYAQKKQAFEANIVRME
jgi:hypothetical protein